MSRVKTSLAVLALVLAATTTGCASTASKQEKAQKAELEKAMEEAMKPASPEEVAAANRADPLTKANFWSKEYTKAPENLETAITFAKALREIGSDDRAIDVLSQVMVIHPDSADLLMVLGRALSTKQDFSAAIQAYSQAATLEPQRAEAWAALGTAFDQIDRHADAQAAYERALAIEPTRTSTLANYGLSLALAGDLAGAEAKLRLADAQPDTDTRVKENLALVLGLQGKYVEMKAASGGNAPTRIIEQNAELLREMVQPTRTWDALAEKAELGKLPATPRPSGPAAERPAAATSTPVSDMPEALPETSDTGLRLRRPN
ncbi:MAG: tetratricopeptide repeat protein [Alphaproteobacteria bacterium]|uniref:tetratricopeptide repeat protein n=1 Tax=Hyphomonas sp. TaxID=87 RepID=UPI001DFCC82F|nr:tetratricopeptide repeat protein [Alphaproteobacteria bacterium]MBU2085280.1 tetratricopeptide repeat protein [Alphaproteobacteria bacterium]MBU2142375.1 tetratricopeptide repeat protein [Alphaproteobacteria bacterium]MBU2197511.1 tetratricopeptide repeat protein [Alphaproteobacteria bacterium]